MPAGEIESVVCVGVCVFAGLALSAYIGKNISKRFKQSKYRPRIKNMPVKISKKSMQMGNNYY